MHGKSPNCVPGECEKVGAVLKAKHTALCRMAFAASSVANVTMHNRFTCAVCEGKKL